MKRSEILLKALNDIDDSFIEEAPTETFKVRRGFSWGELKRWIPAMAVVLVAVIITGRVIHDRTVTMVNPTQEVATIAEAEKITGFPIGIPEEYEGQKYSTITVINETVIRVSYGEENKKILIISKGVSDEDISGDYNSYRETDTHEYKGVEITTKGNDGQISLATWSIDRYSFAVSVPEGIEFSDLKKLFDEIH